MPLLDHFRPPLHTLRHWEGFHHAWATLIAKHLNDDVLPRDYFAEPEIQLGPELEIDVATQRNLDFPTAGAATAVWNPPRPKQVVTVDFSRLEAIEVRIFYDIGTIELRAAIELVSPANKDRAETRDTFAAKCASYLRHGVSVVVVDVVTSRRANLHGQILEMLEAAGRKPIWQSSTGLYAVAYRATPIRKKPRVEIWPETLRIGKPLPTLPLWLQTDLVVPLDLESTYQATCRSLRIPA